MPHARTRHAVAICLMVCACLLAGIAHWAGAGEITLKNGTRLQGRLSPLQSLNFGPQAGDKGPIPNYPIIMVTSDLQRYFVPRVQAIPETINNDQQLSKFEVFKLPQQRRGGSKAVQQIGGYIATPFDTFGRRTITLKTPTGEEQYIQGITQITPQYIKIEGLNCKWETGVATTSIPKANLDAMLRQVTKKDNPDHRLAIAKFYIEAELYREAKRELDSIREEFKELANTVESVSDRLTQLQARQIVSELKLRQNAGQHQFVYDALQLFAKEFSLDKVDANVKRDIRDLQEGYDKRREEAVKAVALMGELQAVLKDQKHVEAVAPRRLEIAENLHIMNNFDRLDAFVKLSQDPQLPAEEKLALALSGWVVGSTNAVTDLDLALRLWQARYLVLDYLRTSPDGGVDRTRVMEKLLAIEAISINRIAQMIPLLPPIADTNGVAPGVALQLQIPKRADRPAVDYQVLLPVEYHPDHSYPAIIALHRQGAGPASELDYWGGAVEGAGQSQRHGYIVIAPEYAATDQRAYDYGPNAHYAVIDALNDARRRFNIDSDRVFLSGHAMGGDAAFDIGFSHPDLFAGVIPFGGVLEKFSKIYWENAERLPLYIVAGEFDRDTPQKNANQLTMMMKKYYDIIYTEYTGYGQDGFYAEIHKLFAWMGRQRRLRFPADMDIRTRRVSDTRFWWFQFNSLPRTVTDIDWTSNQRKPVGATTARLSPGGSNISISGTPAASHTFWLSPEMGKDLFEKRLEISINGTRRWNNFIKPDIAALLEDVRRRGDRQQLYWAVLEF